MKYSPYPITFQIQTLDINGTYILRYEPFLVRLLLYEECNAPRPALGLTQPPIQWVPGLLPRK